MKALQQVDHPDNIVYGVPKGGMIAAGFLTNAKRTWNPQEATIIIDDLVDSGATRKKYRSLFPNTPFVSLFSKESKDWIVFPWEADHPGGEDSIQQNISRILQYIGEDPNREGLQETPERVVRMWKEIFRGYDPAKYPKVTVFKNRKDGLIYDQMILDSGDFYSHCEHHMVPFFGQYWFGYIPSRDGNILGLSKVARIVDYHCAKLQIQERLVQDIVEDLWNTLSSRSVPPVGMGLMMVGEHLCKTMRGAKKKGSMTTIKLKGAFLLEQTTRAEFLSRCGGNTL